MASRRRASRERRRSCACSCGPGAHAIDTSSPVNLFLVTGRSLVATRFSFDYGWYPDDALLETDLPYCSLWYTVGGAYVQGEMAAGDVLRSLLIASEHSPWTPPRGSRCRSTR